MTITLKSVIKEHSIKLPNQPGAGTKEGFRPGEHEKIFCHKKHKNDS